jgi:hypothetical protein
MIDTAVALYPHRKKMDGSSDALCLNCLATVTEMQHGSEASGYDPTHTCSSWLSAGRDKPARPQAA